MFPCHEIYRVEGAGLFRQYGSGTGRARIPNRDEGIYSLIHVYDQLLQQQRTVHSVDEKKIRIQREWGDWGGALLRKSSVGGRNCLNKWVILELKDIIIPNYSFSALKKNMIFVSMSKLRQFPNNNYNFWQYTVQFRNSRSFEHYFVMHIRLITTYNVTFRYGQLFTNSWKFGVLYRKSHSLTEN